MKSATHRLTVTCGLTIFAFSGRIVCGQTDSLLRFNWQAGRRYVMSLETSKQIVIPNLPPDANKGEENEKRQFSIVALKKAQQPGCELNVECLSTKYDKGGDGSFSFDSRNDPKKDAGIPIAAMFTGIKLHYLLDADQKVLRVNGTDELVRKILDHNPSLKNDLSTPFVTRAQFGTNTLSELLQEFMVVGLPRKNLKVGDRWTCRTEHSSDATIVEIQFTFAALEEHLDHHCARIGIDGDIKGSSNRGDLPAGWPADFPLPKVHGHINGNLWLDTNLAMLIERTTVEERQTTIEMPTGNTGKDTSSPMTVNEKRTVTSKLIKIEDN
jgi:hypothetical protein